MFPPMLVIEINQRADVAAKLGVLLGPMFCLWQAVSALVGGRHSRLMFPGNRRLLYVNSGLIST